MLHAIAVMIAVWFVCCAAKEFVCGLIEDVPKLRWLYIMLEHGITFCNIIFILGSLATLWSAIGTLGSFFDGYIGAGFGLLVLTLVLAFITFMCAIASHTEGLENIKNGIKMMKKPMVIAGNVKNKDELYDLEHYALNEIYVVNEINTPYICADDDEWQELDKDIFDRIKAGEKITRADIEGVDVDNLNEDGTPKTPPPEEDEEDEQPAEPEPPEVDDRLWKDPHFKGMLMSLDAIKSTANPTEGDVMYDMGGMKVYKYNGTDWVETEEFYKNEKE